jgi:hypothetical protein
MITLMRSTILIEFFLFIQACRAFVIALRVTRHRVLNGASNNGLDECLMGIAKELKLEIMDLNEGIYGHDSIDHCYGL